MHFLHMSWLNFKGQRAAFNLEEFLLLETAYPFITLIFYCVTAGYAYETADVTDWVIGNAFLLCTNICVFSLGNSFVGERRYGRIRSIIVGQVSKIVIVLQKGFFAGGVSLVTTFIGFALGCLVFNISWKEIPWVSLLIVLVVAMFAAMAFGLFLSVLGLISHQMHLVLNLVQYLLLIFTGANFPVEQLPVGARMVSYVLPLTRSIEVARDFVSGTDLEAVIGAMCGEILVGIGYILLAVAVVKYAERVAVKKGTLELF